MLLTLAAASLLSLALIAGALLLFVVLFMCTTGALVFYELLNLLLIPAQMSYHFVVSVCLSIATFSQTFPPPLLYPFW